MHLEYRYILPRSLDSVVQSNIEVPSSVSFKSDAAATVPTVSLTSSQQGISSQLSSMIHRATSISSETQVIGYHF